MTPKVSHCEADRFVRRAKILLYVWVGFGPVKIYQWVISVLFEIPLHPHLEHVGDDVQVGACIETRYRTR